ncbi:DUF1810 domain-containing protein [Paracoccus salsus]|uniref:DUF1810 domain-containing protein n=1 Tax=Paracoccus salsus TaxID=2911061 RepID=UPI001F25808F|nr:DUF1810 domain-containing protein [Paracoccus salsus]MCF3972395.1 DUF1810 domain-containing protein [Paracoccus salsus]
MSRVTLSDESGMLERFVSAQADIYDTALSELRQGRKQSHWMWFIFPQLRGLGQSPASRHYGIVDLDEARRYLAHRVLRPRLVTCAEAVLAHEGVPADSILGKVDAGKLRSSATLFAAAGGSSAVFDRILTQFFDGRPCPRTLERLG